MRAVQFRIAKNQRRQNIACALCVASCVVLAVGSAVAGPKQKSKEAPVSLTAAGEKLQAQYAAALTALQAEISKALPKIDEPKKAAFLKAFEAEKAAEAEANAKQKALKANQGTAAAEEKAKKSVVDAGKAEADAQEKVKQAAVAKYAAQEDAAKAQNAAQQALVKAQANSAKAANALKVAQEACVKAQADAPKVAEDFTAAQAALAVKQTDLLKAVNELKADLDPFLVSGKLDARLVKWEVLNGATAHGLAEFAQQGKEQEALVEKLLADDALMKQMAVADGAEGGKYGRAMEIYTAIQKASPQAKNGVLQRLALGIALEHAVPVGQSNPHAETNAPAIVDPVKRYLHFEKAYLDGELDPAFKDLTVWDYRNVVNGDEPDEILAWGRQMLHNYRPDHIETSDYRWRYVKAVKTEVKYGSANNKYDLPTQQSYQNIIKNGGVCGRRAFFGRFILRCFGIPTVARPQSGHAALAHWTPDGWVINLGATWGFGKPMGRYGRDVDFLAMTQARKVEKAYLEVQRARWIGDALGEERATEFKGHATGFWNSVALCRQGQIIKESKAVTLEAVGKDIAEANESKEKDVVVKVEVTEADRKIDVAQNGVITIPAVACKNTSTNTATIVFMKSNLGGMQMHYERVSKPATFEYTFDAPQAGKYALVARVVTVSSDQSLLVTPNDAKEPVVMNMPYTVGMWQKSEPVEITLAMGKNVLKLDRPPQYRGLTIKDFTLTPVK